MKNINKKIILDWLYRSGVDLRTNVSMLLTLVIGGIVTEVLWGASEMFFYFAMMSFLISTIIATMMYIPMKIIQRKFEKQIYYKK